MKVEEAVEGIDSILLDSAPIIYHLERHPTFRPAMHEFFRIQRLKPITIITSPVALTECLVLPLKRNLAELAEAYRELIVRAKHTRFCWIGDAEAEEAARRRGQHNIPFADALQAAVAIRSGAQAILTNDPVFKRVAEFRTLMVSELEP